MPQRIDFTDEVEHPDANGTFKAKYDGVCHSCGFGIDKGEECHYVGVRVAHGTCHEINGNGLLSNSIGQSAEREPAYVVRGKRTPPLCGSCFLEHNGECP